MKKIVLRVIFFAGPVKDLSLPEKFDYVDIVANFTKRSYGTQLFVIIFSTNQTSPRDEKTKNASANKADAWSAQIDQKTHFRSVGTFGGNRINSDKAIFALIFSGRHFTAQGTLRETPRGHKWNAVLSKRDA
jgi:hypothetical protein